MFVKLIAIVTVLLYNGLTQDETYTARVTFDTVEACEAFKASPAGEAAVQELRDMLPTNETVTKVECVPPEVEPEALDLDAAYHMLGDVLRRMADEGFPGSRPYLLATAPGGGEGWPSHTVHFPEPVVASRREIDPWVPIGLK